MVGGQNNKGANQMSIKINKNDKSYPVGVIPQNVIDDVTDLKNLFKVIKHTATETISIPSGKMSLFEVTDLIPSGYMPIGASFERLGTEGSNIIVMGSPFKDRDGKWYLMFYNWYNTSLNIRPKVNILCVKSA